MEGVAIAESAGLSNMIEDQFSQNLLQFPRRNSYDVVLARRGEAKHSQVQQF